MPIVTLNDLLAGNLNQRLNATIPKLTPAEQARTKNYIHILPHEIKVNIFQLYIEQVLDRTTSLAFLLHHPADRDRYHDAVIAGKHLAAGNRLLDGMPDAAGDVRISVQLLVKEKLKEQRQPTATAETVKRLEVELKALTKLATRCVRLLSPIEEAKADPKPFGYEFNEDGTFYGADDHYEDLEEEYTHNGGCVSTPSTIRLDLNEDHLGRFDRNIIDGEEDLPRSRLRARRPSDPFGLDDDDDGDDDECHERLLTHCDILDAKEVNALQEDAAVSIKIEEQASQPITPRAEQTGCQPTTMTEERHHPISLMEDLECHGYKLNAGGTVWIAPKRMSEGIAFKPPTRVIVKKEEVAQRPVSAKKEETIQRRVTATKEKTTQFVKVDDELKLELEPEPFGYRFNDDGTFSDD